MKLLIAVLTAAVVISYPVMLARHNADHHPHVPTRCGERPPLEVTGHA